MTRKKVSISGFTLIELSIVLVIIGLIVGGVLAGQDLIRAAAARAQITQIEKFRTAVNTFYGKYGALPGDIPAAQVTQFGFKADPVRVGTAGLGDGNGELDGYWGGTPYSWNQDGENTYFWEDLSANSSLIEGTFNKSVGSGNADCSSAITCSAFFPAAKIGGGNFVYVYSGYASQCIPSCPVSTSLGPNFFGLSVVTSVNSGNFQVGSTPGLTVQQAFAIDKKMDDGLPTSGSVLAQYLGPGTGQPQWTINASPDSATTCYNTSSNAYSIAWAGGSNVNCALSFKFQ